MKVCLSVFVLAVALAIGVSSLGSAHQVVVGKLKIGHPWVREAAEGAPGTYSCIIEIQNDGDEPERLLGATIEGAGTGVLYKLTESGGHYTSRPFEEWSRHQAAWKHRTDAERHTNSNSAGLQRP